MPRFAFLAIVILLSASQMAQAKKIALIIGNSAYEEVAKLANPVSDAHHAEKLFSNLGFETLVGLDLAAQEMKTLLKTFNEKSNGNDVALIYFAGHGVQIENKNFLLPIDVKPQNASSVQETSIKLETLSAAFSSSAKSKILMLDACRDNPFSSTTRSLTNDPIVKTRGLARANHEVSDLMVVYAAQPNRVALDGNKGNSPFVRAVSDSLQASESVKLTNALVDITNHVRTNTLDKQIPYIEGTLSIHVEFKVNSVVEQNAVLTKNEGDKCKKNLAKLPLFATKNEEFIELSPSKSGLQVISNNKEALITICPEADEISIEAKFPTRFKCDQMHSEKNEGVGFYFSDANSSPAHVWLHINKENASPNLEIGFYSDGDEQKWVVTGWKTCG